MKLCIKAYLGAFSTLFHIHTAYSLHSLTPYLTAFTPLHHILQPPLPHTLPYSLHSLTPYLTASTPSHLTLQPSPPYTISYSLNFTSSYLNLHFTSLNKLAYRIHYVISDSNLHSISSSILCGFPHSFPYDISSKITYSIFLSAYQVSFLRIFFYWAFLYSLLITILRTGSGFELWALHIACCLALLLHRRTLASSCDFPQQQRHSADIEIRSPLW